jgi:hypothetical protein
MRARALRRGDVLQPGCGLEGADEGFQGYDGGESMEGLVDGGLLAYEARLLPWSVPGSFGGEALFVMEVL